MSKFKDKVLQVTRAVPYGKVVSYGQVALMVGIPRAAIQVGQALNQMEGVEMPWWRVINNGGRISIKGPRHTAKMQKEHLESEGVKVTNKLEIDIEGYRWRPSPGEMQKFGLDDEYVGMIIEKYLL